MEIPEIPLSPKLQIQTDEIVENQNGIRLNDNAIRSLSVVKIFQQNSKPINSIGFTTNGEFACTSAYDGQINLYDCLEGTHKLTSFSKKYGSFGVTFTHCKSAVLYASTNVNHDLRYQSLHDNKYIRYFSGHSDQVTTISMSPSNDTFLTSSLDKTVRLWDLRAPRCEGLMHLLSPAICSFDNISVVFSVGCHQDGTIKMFDCRHYEKGPFSTFKLPLDADPTACPWSSLTFSPNGEKILINTTGNVVRIIEAFEGNLEWAIDARIVPPLEQQPVWKLDATFSADSEYVFCASSNGKMNVWRLDSGAFIGTLNPLQPSVMGCVKFNPKYSLIMSAMVDTAFWIPSVTTSCSEDAVAENTTKDEENLEGANSFKALKNQQFGRSSLLLC